MTDHLIRHWRSWRKRIQAAGAARSGTLARVIENAAWLLSGKAVAAILSLIYIALATRLLGPERFGQFVLILGTGQGVSALVSFSTWQIVVQYGVSHLHSNDREALGRLLAFCLALDAATALAGCLLAAAVVLFAGPHLGWDGTLSRDALLFSFAVLLSIRSTAVGILRLYDRFGIAAAADAVTPVIRLAGAGLAVANGASITGFLIAWATAETLTAVVHWIAAARAAQGSLLVTSWRELGGAPADNPGLWRFAATTNMAATLKAFSRQGSVLLVGLFVGPIAAGSFRLASQLGGALAKWADLLARAMFAEMARIHNSRPADQLRSLFTRTTRFSLIGGAIIILILLAFGRPALGLIAGDKYQNAYPLVLMLGVAAAVDIGGASFEPTLMAIGRAGQAFRLRLATTLMQLTLLLAALPLFGVQGAAGASLAAASLSLILFGTTTWRAVGGPHPISTPAPSA